MGISKKKYKNGWAGYVFLTPWLLGFICLTAIPMIMSLYFSFTNYDMFTTPKFIGLTNYQNMVKDPKFIKSLTVTFKYVVLSVPLQLSAALFIATILNKNIKGVRLYRAIYYLPSLFGGSVAVSILWRQLFNKEGILNKVLSVVGIEGKNWISEPNTALYTLILLAVWQFGSSMIIFLAGLKQIPQDYYEAADIDGAGKVRKFFFITLPLLTPIVFFNVVMQIINAFQSFTSAYIISGGNGSPLDSTLFYTLYLYIKAFQHFQMGYASALAWVLLVIISIVTALLFLTSRKWVHYES